MAASDGQSVCSMVPYVFMTHPSCQGCPAGGSPDHSQLCHAYNYSHIHVYLLNQPFIHSQIGKATTSLAATVAASNTPRPFYRPDDLPHPISSAFNHSSTLSPVLTHIKLFIHQQTSLTHLLCWKLMRDHWMWKTLSRTSLGLLSFTRNLKLSEVS